MILDVLHLRWHWERIEERATLPDGIHLLCGMPQMLIRSLRLTRHQRKSKRRERLMRDFKEFGLSGDEGLDRAKQKKGRVNNEDQNWVACLAARLVCSVVCWTLNSKMNNTFHSNDKNVNSSTDTTDLVFMFFLFFFGHCVLLNWGFRRFLIVDR